MLSGSHITGAELAPLTRLVELRALAAEGIKPVERCVRPPRSISEAEQFVFGWFRFASAQNHRRRAEADRQGTACNPDLVYRNGPDRSGTESARGVTAPRERQFQCVARRHRFALAALKARTDCSWPKAPQNRAGQNRPPRLIWRPPTFARKSQRLVPRPDRCPRGPNCFFHRMATHHVLPKSQWPRCCGPANRHRQRTARMKSAAGRRIHRTRHVARQHDPPLLLRRFQCRHR